MQLSMHRHAAGRSFRISQVIAAAGAALFLYLRNFLVFGTPFFAAGDQSQFFSRAIRILHGQVPYRDFFAFVTPGTEYLFAAGFRIFGVHAWVISAWSVVTGFAFCWMLTCFADHILPESMRFFPALLFLVFAYNGSPDLTHHWFSTLAALSAAAVLVPGLTLGRTAAAGTLCAVATFFTQTEGLAAFAGIAVYLCWRRFGDASGVHPRGKFALRFAVFSIAFAAVLAVALGMLARTAGLRTLFFDLILFAPRYLSFTGLYSAGYLHQFPSVHRAAGLLALVPALFVYALVPYVYGIGLFRLFRRRTMLPAALLQNLVLLHCVGTALFCSVANSPRLFRLSTIAAPAILILSWLLGEPGRLVTVLRNALTAAALIFALMLPLHRQIEHREILDLSIGRTAFADPLSAAEFRWLAARTHAGESFFNSPPLALYLAQRNPTPLEFINATESTRPEWVAGVLAAFNRDPPHFIVLQGMDRTRPPSQDNTVPIREFVQQNYRRAAVFRLYGGFTYQEEVWERAPSDSQHQP
jgi:hypothetical protein